ncbi:MAG: SufS family cysteine desulfurase [Bacteroidia bacterium]
MAFESVYISNEKLEEIRNQFPILMEKVNGKPLVYFDNAATSQKPKTVIDAIVEFYTHQNANIHRGVHSLSQKATDAYEHARRKIASFINAPKPEQIIFTRGTTESINLVAFSYARTFLNAGDEIIISALEHHSNIVPWQMVCEEKNLSLKVIPINDDGDLILEEYEKLLSNKTKIVAVNHISNALGTINPIKTIIEKAHAAGAIVLIDGAQSISHIPIDVQTLDCDFFAFSGHKMFASTGIGVLYGKEELLNKMPPFMGGGDMIKTVTFEKTEYNELPHKFEAGTPHIEAGITITKAIEFIESVGFDFIKEQENNLLQYATERLKEINCVKIIGNPIRKTSVISFIVEGIHPYDIGVLLDKMGIAVRTGHHCTQPIMDRFCIPGTVRASFAFYNTTQEIDIFINSLNKAIEMLR